MMTKRIFSALLAAALSLSLLAGCGSASGSTASSAADGPQRYSTVFYDVFDTVTQVIAYCDSEEEFTAQMDALHADLVEYNQLYDIYNDYDGVTNIKTINDNAGTAPVTVDDKILGMLELAQTMYDTTGGKLNIALGSVLNIWHNYREAALADDNDSNNQLPTQEELDAAAQHCDIANLIIDEDAKTVYLADPAMSLDVGSVGKGYAVEQAAQAAEARGLTSALISVGGNLRAIGTKPDGSQWVGGVENPWNSSEVYTNGSSTVAAVKMSGLSLVTSGDYQRYYVVDGVRYHHLIDPATLWPAAYFDGVSVLAPDSGVADEGSLRGSSEVVAKRIQGEIQKNVTSAGIEIIEARITYLAYAPEIAAVMLQRQQASAIIDARKMIVDGAVGMVEMALDRLSENKVVELDDERKAAMVSNLLVVLCGNRDAQPIVNSGSLY